MNPEDPRPTLESWKEIAAYLQRDAKTARRWEKEEGLPVHRHNHNSRSSVYAYPDQIDAWRLTRKNAPEPVAAPARTFWRVPAFALAIFLCLMMVGNGIRPQAASAGQGKAIAKRLVCENCGALASLSRDGRTEVFQDRETEDLVRRNMSTGKDTKLGVLPETDGADSPLISPDGKQIVYTWEPGYKGNQLAIVLNQAGAKPRVLLKDDPGYSYYEADAWFPDGKSVLSYLSKRDKSHVIARLAVADGAVTVLKALEARISGLSLSPDGRYIAYSAGTAPPGKDRYIFLMTADGSQETEIVKSAGNNASPVWAPDGRHILFTSDRSGTTDLWSIPVQSGKATGPESLVSPDLGKTLVALKGTYGGSLFYSAVQSGEYIRIANAGSGSPDAADRFVGVSPRWSPDGKSIAFKRHRAGSSDQYDLVIHSLETGSEKTYSTTLGTSGGNSPFWFHDGKTLMTGIRRPDGYGAVNPGLFYRIDVASGEFKALPGGAGPSAISPDDKTRYVVARQDGKPDRILAIDVETGKEKQIFESRSRAGLAIGLSPDGSTLALGWLDRPPVVPAGPSKLHIARLSVDGSGYREIHTVDGFYGGYTVAWTKDGQSILFNQEQPEGASHWNIMRVPAEGGAAEKFAPGTNRPFNLSPDGSRVVYGTFESENQLWALDNVLAALK